MIRDLDCASPSTVSWPLMAIWAVRDLGVHWRTLTGQRPTKRLSLPCNRIKPKKATSLYKKTTEGMLPFRLFAEIPFTGKTGREKAVFCRKLTDWVLEF